MNRRYATFLLEENYKKPFKNLECTQGELYESSLCDFLVGGVLNVQQCESHESSLCDFLVGGVWNAHIAIRLHGKKN
jgi:hypothetical protein